MEKKGFIYRCTNPILLGLFSALAGALLCLPLFDERIISGAFIGIFIIYPFALTGMQFLLLSSAGRDETLYRRGRWTDIVTIVLGVLYSLLYLNAFDVMLSSDWTETLYNAQKHQPVYTDAIPTVLTIAAVGFVGYLIVNFIPLKKMPPLLLCLGVAGMYLGTALSIVWYIQVCSEDIMLLWLLPLNCVIITVRTVIHKVSEWHSDPYESQKINSNRLLRWCNNALDRTAGLPLIALAITAPLLGCIIVVLILFGQSPDSIIKAWTETSEWTMSQMVSPPNIDNGHYLCTVAAEGHKEIVKPLRKGVRHGAEVTVNRQLCIANAFEQVLEERTPRLHRAVRAFYDKYGLPISRYIRTKGAADIVYIIMKPLEWVFLAVLYLTDPHPENRIAIQYTGKQLKDFKLKD